VFTSGEKKHLSRHHSQVGANQSFYAISFWHLRECDAHLALFFSSRVALVTMIDSDLERRRVGKLDMCASVVTFVALTEEAPLLSIMICSKTLECDATHPKSLSSSNFVEFCMLYEENTSFDKMTRV
jgi:hypothetical protein